MATTAEQVLSLENAKLAVGQTNDKFDDLIRSQVKAAIGLVSADIGSPLIDEEISVRVRRSSSPTGEMLFNTPVPVRSLGKLSFIDGDDSPGELDPADLTPFSLPRSGTASKLKPDRFGVTEWPEFAADPTLIVVFGQDSSSAGDGSGLPAKYVQAVVLMLRSMFRGDPLDRQIYNPLVGLPPPDDEDG